MLPTRPISPGLLAPPPFDPPRLIQEAMGGRQFFFDIGARAVHRVGLMLGLAWRLPFGEAADRIDLVKVQVEPGKGGTFLMEFRRLLHFDADGCSLTESELVRAVLGVKIDDLRTTYEENTGATA